MPVVMESKLSVKLVDNVTGPARAINAVLGQLRNASQRNALALDAMRGRMLDAMGAGYALWRGLAAPTNAAIAFESAMADIKKVVDFETPQALTKMSADIREMSLRIPMAADGIAQIVAAAGQSGIAQTELTKFAEIAAKVGVAWDMGASETGEALAKLKTALGRNLADTASLADAINHLGNNSAASAPQILDVVKRVAPMASQFGMTAEQVAALGAAMTGSGFESEVAATSILNIGRALTKGAGATGRQTAAFRKLGLTSKDVAKAMQKDAVGTLQDVLNRVGKLPADMRASLVSDLFGDEARALGPLISNGKLLADTLALISDRSRYAGSAQREFESASQRTANNLQLFRNRVNDLGISIGNALLPALNKLVNIIGPMVTSLSEMAERFPQVTFAITAATSAVIGLRVAITAARFAGLFAIGGFLRMAMALTGFTSVVVTVGAALAAISAPVWLAIAAGVAAVAAVAGILYSRWDRIVASAKGVALAIGDQLAPAFEAARPVIEAFAPAFSAIGDAADWVKSKLSAALDWLKVLFSPEVMTYQHSEAVTAGMRATTNKIINIVKSSAVQMYAAGMEMIQSLWDGAVAKFNELLAWFSDLPNRIKAAIGRIDLSNIISWPSLPSWAGGTPTETGGQKVDGKRARGGPVSAGRTYLVGERGPELFSPGRSGFVSPNEVYRAANSAAGSGVATRSNDAGSSSVVYLSPVFHIYGATDAKAVGDHVLSRLSNSMKDLGEAAFSD